MAFLGTWAGISSASKEVDEIFYFLYRYFTTPAELKMQPTIHLQRQRGFLNRIVSK
jgi:hypothetical protein